MIIVFAISFFIMYNTEGFGHLQGYFNGSLLDCVYFCFTTFSTLGTGKIEISDIYD